VRHGLAVDRCGSKVTAGPEVRREPPIRGKAPLGRPWRLDPWPPPLALTGGLRRGLRTVVQIAGLAMCGAGAHRPRGRALAPQCIGHDASGDGLTPVQALAQEALRGLLIASALDPEVQDSPGLIDRPPAIVALALARQQHLIQGPCVARLRAPMPELSGRGWPTLAAPLAAGFIRDGEATGQQPFFTIAVAETKEEGQLIPPLPEAIILVLAPFEPRFSPRVWRHAQVLLLRAILAPGTPIGERAGNLARDTTGALRVSPQVPAPTRRS
jgi:hypothetical protein